MAEMESSSLELLNVIHDRRSLRRFSDRRVSEESLRRILEAGSWAPTACNQQEYRFIVVSDPSLHEAMVAAGGTSLITAAPLGILVVYRESLRNRYYRDDIQSASACIENMLLSAQSLGVGACWICDLPNRSTLRTLFGIPGSFLPVAYILLGYPEEGYAPLPVPRKVSLEAVTGWNSFPGGGGETSSWLTRALIPLAAAIYRRLPSRVKSGWLRPLLARCGFRRFEGR